MTTKHTYDRQINFVGNIRQALQVATTDNETLFKIIMDTLQERDDYRMERNTLRQGLVAITEAVTGEPAENDFLSPDVLTTLISELRTERDKAVNTLTLAGYTDNGGELWKPKLGETPERFKPRYIVHGHVQPCVVLYSDETTTLIRLDNEDMMCETSTIQWSDALTYRCQELLASAGLERGSMAVQRVLPVLTELVRDERVAVEQPHLRHSASHRANDNRLHH